jgi:hypothetical protein
MNFAAGSTVSAEVAGYSGGWLNWDVDTGAELRAAAIRALTAIGMPPQGFALELGEDLGAFLMHGTFAYVAKFSFKVPRAMTDSELRTILSNTFEGVARHVPTVSIRSAGEPGLSDTIPNWDVGEVLPSATSINVTLGLLAVVLFGSLLVLGKLKP